MDVQELKRRAGILTENSKEADAFFEAAANLLRILELNPRALTPEQAGNLRGMAQQLANAADQSMGM